jgi:RimJ/RimL family protein N-acetyltransferase
VLVTHRSGEAPFSDSLDQGSNCGSETWHELRMIDKSSSAVRLKLRPFGREDFARLASWLPTEAELVEWCAGFFRYPLTDDQLQRYLESTKQPNARVIFVGEDINGNPVGHIEISQIWPYLSSRLSRVLVAPGKRRRGFASTMVAEALIFSFGEHHVDRVDLGVSASNSAAIGCYEKLGFMRGGTWPNAIMVGSHTLDVLWMTITRDRWLRSNNGTPSPATHHT